MEKVETERTNCPAATIGETQNIIQIRARLELMEKNLSKENALALAKRIRPVITQVIREDGDLVFKKDEPVGDKYWVSGAKIYNQSYFFMGLNSRSVYERAENLTEVATITTYHKCGYPAILKPSVYEVLCQIPRELLDKVVAFELYAPSCYVSDIYDSHLDRHKLTCVLYSGTIPKSVADKEVDW